MLKGFPDLPPVWLLGAMILSWGLGPLWPWPFFVDGFAWIGGALVAAGLALVLWCGLWFLRKRTPIEPHHTPKALITEGPYRLSRNPIYLALVVIALGVALRAGGLLALLPVPVLWWVLDRRFAAPEEALLRDVFGAEAEAWLARSRRWL